MELVSTRALADFLRRERDALLDAWEAHAKRIPDAPPLPAALLRDHMPALLEELARELEQPETARHRLRRFSAAHGEHRRRLGMHVLQVVEEYKLLRRCILDRAEARGIAVTGEGWRIVNELIDEGVGAAIAAYIDQRDAAEKQRRQEYLKFIVHDLRSPLAAVYYAILLAEREVEGLEAAERVRTVHAAIKRNVERMRALIDRLLQEERNARAPHRLEIEREAIELWPIVQSTIHALSPLAAVARTEMVNRVPSEMKLHADPELIERVLQNLIANALRHTEDGCIEIGATRRADGTIECWVADNGSGMPEETRAHILDERTAGDGDSGLGLAFVKRAIEAHSGNIDVQSQVDRGTTVRFSIPPG